MVLSTNCGAVMYSPKYENSWALVVGINAYRYCAPLGYATQDAMAVATALEKSCGFDRSRITLLTDGAATTSAIREAFFRLTDPEVQPNDRVVVFFAGHGYTRTDPRGEVGFLAPVDARVENLASLWRWDDLTRNAGLIKAKHVLFVMDACYGGLAVTRSLSPGSSRFLKDMLVRYSRQVLTAGKADETVADSGGPRPGHSVFTGHFLDAIEGAAKSADGVLSTNSVISYVYDKVANDQFSRQTPHYGYLDGDGDLILQGYPIADETDQPKPSDVLIQVSAAQVTQTLPEGESIPDEAKRLLSDPGGRIRLDDLVNREIRKAAALTVDAKFPTESPFTLEEILSRLESYEQSVFPVLDPLILIARWGDANHQLLIRKAVGRLSDGIGQTGGITGWLGLRWYPIELLFYSVGITAMYTENGGALFNLFRVPLRGNATGGNSSDAIDCVVDGMLDVTRAKTFERMPGYERRYTAKSDYLFSRLQPKLEDLLFLGGDYEERFDEFEVIYALIYADDRKSRGEHFWGPPGRFGWKRRGGNNDPLQRMVERARVQGDSWFIIQSGFFGGSASRFIEIAESYRSELLSRLGWL
jgi:hypothetical protein